jgi:hypothetical protein
MVQSRWYFNIFLDVLRKIRRSLSQNSQCPRRDSNWAPFEFESKESALRQHARWFLVV